MDLFSCLCSLLCLGAVWAELQLSVVSPKTAILGSDTLLECTFTVDMSHVDLQYLEIIWRFQGKDLLSFSDTLNVLDSRASIDETKITDGNASLKLSELKTSHEGEYTCSVIYIPVRKDKTITVNLQAHPRIIVQEPAVIIGKENLLRCSVVGFYPMEISVFWSRDGQILPGSSMSQHQRHSNGTFMVNSTVPIIPTDNDANHTFSCHVHHSSLEGPLQKDVRLLLQEEARSVSVTVVVLPMLAIVVIMAVLGWFLYRRLAHRELALCEIQGPVTWMVGETIELVCVGNYYPEDIKVTWIKLHKCKETEIEVWTSPTKDEVQPLLSMNRYRAESSKAAGNLTLTSTLFITPSLEEDEGAVFKCRFFTSDDKVKEEKEFKGFKLYDKPQVDGNIACVPCDGMNVQCTLDLRHFYPEEIQIKWSSGSGKLEDASSKECETENADRRTFNVRTECIITEEAFNNGNFKIRVTWEHASLKEPEYREMSVTDPDFPGHPLLEGIVVPPLIHGCEASLQCRVAEYFPKKLHVQWLKVEKTSDGHYRQHAVGNEVVPQPDGNERVNKVNTRDDHVPQSDGPLTISSGIYGFVSPSEGISVPSFEFDSSEIPVPPSDESDEDVPPFDESERPVPQSDERDGLVYRSNNEQVNQCNASDGIVPQSNANDWLVSQTNGSEGQNPQSNGRDKRVNQINASDDLDLHFNRSDGHEPQFEGPVTTFNGINGSAPQYKGNDGPVPPSDGSFMPAVLSNENGVPVPRSNAYASLDRDLSSYKSTCTILHHEPMKGYSCTACLTFTPDLRRDQGSTFICRVFHPSLKEALEKSTGKLNVLMAVLQVVMGPSPDVTPPGRDTLVECLFYVDQMPVDLSLLVVTWQLHGQMLVEYNETVTAYNPRTRVCPDELKKGNASLALVDPLPADSGEYTCTVLYDNESGQGSVFLKVEAKPYLSLENQVVVVNEYSQLSCSITGHYPNNISVQWLRNGQLLMGGVLSPTEDSTDAYPKLISRYPIIPSFTDANAIYTCRAIHESLTSELETSFSPILGVRPIVSLQDRGWTKKRFLNFVCNVSTFYPGEISVVWLVNGQPSDIHTTTRRWRNIDGTYNLEESYVFEPYARHNSALFSCVVHHGTILDNITKSMKLVLFSHLPNWMWYVFAASLVLVGLSYLRRRVDDIVSLNDWIDGNIVTLDCQMKGRVPANVSAVWVIKKMGQEQEIRETKVNRWSEDYTELINRDRYSCSSTLVKSGLCGISRSFSSSLVFQVSKAEDDGTEFICRFMSVDKVLAEKSRPGVVLDNKTYYSISGLTVPKECVAGQMLILSCSLKGAFPQKTEVTWEKIQGEKRVVIWSGPGGGIATTQDVSAPPYQITESCSENMLMTYLSFLPTLQDHDAQFFCRFFDDGGRVNAECRSQGLNVVRAMERKPDFCLSSDWGFESTNGVTQDESGL